MECESKILMQHCGCVLYYMPRLNEDTTICNRENSVCYEEIKLAVELGTNSSFRCECLPGCFEISYTADMSTARLGTSGFEGREHVLSNLNKDYVSYVIVICI